MWVLVAEIAAVDVGILENGNSFGSSLALSVDIDMYCILLV